MEADPFADDALGLWPASAPRYGSVAKLHPQPVASLRTSIPSGASGSRSVPRSLLWERIYYDLAFFDLRIDDVAVEFEG